MPPDSSRGYRSTAVRRPTACSFISTSCSITGAGSLVCVRSGSATFSPAVRSVSRPLPCSSTPMPLRSASSSRWRRGTGWPKTSTRPAAGTSSPVMAASRVDLPLPEGPSTAVMPPRGTARSMPDRMVRAPRSRRTPDRRTAMSLGPGIVRQGGAGDCAGSQALAEQRAYCSTASGDSGRICPPSTTSACPVMKPASREARKATAWPMSSGVPSVWVGMMARCWSR